jgi:hypothetical protein
MSKLSDILKKINQTAPAPMGFRTSRTVEKTPSLTIIGEVKGNGAVLKTVAGADAILIRNSEAGMTAKNLQKSAKPLKDTPWGIYLDESEDNAAALTESGCDFVIMSPASPVPAAPQDEKTGKILQIDSAMDDGLLHAVNDLAVDAVLLTDSFDESGALVWHQLMIYRHITAFIGKPVLAPVPATITEIELKALWNAGIDGVVVEVDAAGGDLQSLKDLTAKLPPRTARKPGKTDVRLPGGGSQTAPPDEEEEEEDE